MSTHVNIGYEIESEEELKERIEELREETKGRKYNYSESISLEVQEITSLSEYACFSIFRSANEEYRKFKPFMALIVNIKAFSNFIEEFNNTYTNIKINLVDEILYEHLEVSIDNPYRDDPVILKGFVRKEDDPKYKYIFFSVETDENYSPNSRVVIYYLVGCMIRLFSVAEPYRDRVENLDKDIGFSGLVELSNKLNGTGHALYSEKLEKEYLLLLDNIELVNRVSEILEERIRQTNAIKMLVAANRGEDDVYLRSIRNKFF